MSDPALPTALAAAVRGRVVAPGDAGYDRLRLGFQLAEPHRPDAVVVAADADDVAATVAFVAAHDVALAVQGAGHGPVGAVGGGVLLVTTALADVSVDAAGVARVGAGARWGAVAAAGDPGRFGPPLGSSPDVGVAGYTLGGGLSIIGRTSGWAADRLRRLEVVTAAGERRTVDAGTEPELFWALRGGGGGLAVATSLEIELVPAARLWGGALYVGAAQVEAMVRAWQAWCAELPESVSTSIAHIALPDVPGVPEPLRGQRALGVRVAHVGDPAEGERLVAPLRAVGPTLVDGLGELTFAASGAIHADPTQPTASHIGHTLLSALPDGAVDAFLAAVEAPTDLPYVGEVRLLGGALARTPEGGSPIGNRDAAFLVDTVTVLAAAPATADEVEAAGQARAGLFAALAPWTTGGHLLNWLDGSATQADVRSAFAPDAWDRLVAAKAAWDPTGRLRYADALG